MFININMNELDIDFNDASLQWRQNKKYLLKGNFIYICQYIHSNGKQCSKNATNYTTKLPINNTNTNLIPISLTFSNIYCHKHLVYLSKMGIK